MEKEFELWWREQTKLPPYGTHESYAKSAFLAGCEAQRRRDLVLVAERTNCMLECPNVTISCSECIAQAIEKGSSE